MTNLKRLLLLFSVLLLVSLACSTITGQSGTNQTEPNIVSNDDNPVIVMTATVENNQPATGDNDQPAQEVAPAEQPAAQMDDIGTITAMGDAKGVEILEMNWEQDEDGYITFIGLLKNNGDNELSFVELDFTLRDANGTPVATEYTYSSIDILPPGEVSPFEMYFFDPPYEPWTSYEILIKGDVNEYFTSYTDFEVVSVELTDDGFGYELNGEIKNTGEQSSDFVAIYAIIYNSDNQPISTDFTFAEADALTPGATSTFQIYIWDTFADQTPDHFTLFIEGNLVSE